MWHALDHDQKDWASGSSPAWVIFKRNKELLIPYITLCMTYLFIHLCVCSKYLFDFFIIIQKWV